MKCLFGHDWIQRESPTFLGSRGLWGIKLGPVSVSDEIVLRKYAHGKVVYDYSSMYVICKSSDFNGICRRCHKIQMKYQEKLEQGEKLLSEAKAQESRDSRLVGTLDAHLKMRQYSK